MSAAIKGTIVAKSIKKRHCEYKVESDDGDTLDVGAVQPYKVGDRVRVFWSEMSDQYDKPQMRHLCNKCDRQIIKGSEAIHEFCELSHV